MTVRPADSTVRSPTEAPGAPLRSSFPAPQPVPELTRTDDLPVTGPTRGRHGDGPRTVRSATGTLLLVVAVMSVTTVIAYQVTLRNGALVHNRMLPWILGRSLGVASYLTLAALVVLGIWLRHPWRNRLWSPRPEALLRAHVVLAACTVVLLAGHLVSIALDHYAGVGWTGTFVPWHSHYRPTAVALGTIGLYGIVLVGATAALAGSLAKRVWFPIHSLSALVFCLCLAHGAMAGSDSHTLRWLYVITGGVVGTVQITRWVARHVGRPVAVEFE